MKKILNKLIDPALVLLTVYGVWGASFALALYSLLYLAAGILFFFFAVKIIPILLRNEELKDKWPSMVKCRGESGYWDYLNVAGTTVLLFSGFWVIATIRILGIILMILAQETIIKTEKNDH